MKTTKLLILLLMIDAGVVFAMQLLRLNCWALICLYWGILTIKNLTDWRHSK